MLHRKAEYKNLKNTRNSYLSRDELQQKAEILVTEKRNAIKKAKYWESKFYAESIEVDEEDDADFRQMFDGVSDDQVPEGLKLLFDQQAKAQCVPSLPVEEGGIHNFNLFALQKIGITYLYFL